MSGKLPLISDPLNLGGTDVLHLSAEEQEGNVSALESGGPLDLTIDSWPLMGWM